MANVMDYVDWRGDIEFSSVPLNEVDSLILSSLCYIDFEDIVSPSFNKPILLSTAARSYLRRHRGEKAYVGAIVPAETVALLGRAYKSRRFGRIRVCGYVNHVCDDRQMQFSAITFLLDESNIFIAFRGTDDSIIGWKENFNMSFMHPVPAQLEAVAYLEAAVEERREKIALGGHSKGGNLAVYALAKASAKAKARVGVAYNNDGPGFSREFMDSLDYENTRGKIRTLIPQSSVVGMLLEHEEIYEVIKSSQSGLWQHDPFSWEVMGGSFIHLDTVDKESKFIDKTIKQWLGEISAEDREKFVDDLYNSLSATNAKTLTDLNTDRKKLRKAWNGLDSETRNVVFKYIKLLVKERAKSLLPPRKEKPETAEQAVDDEAVSPEGGVIPTEDA